jgi:ubiquinone/menaquinone biosynthesis C-methylase UbiE
MDLEHLEAIRLKELEDVLAIIPKVKSQKEGKSLSILEIGAGTGWQAKKLSESGYTVEAIDVNDSNYSGSRIWSITNYDGSHIPFSDNYFDVIFSSNVLEHIPHLKEFQGEMQRVLKASGIAVHIVPSGSWRFWMNIAHYPSIIKKLMDLILHKRSFTAKLEGHNVLHDHAVTHPNNISKIRLITKAIFPTRHGETGNALSEIFWFSRYKWSTIFRESGWGIVGVVPNRLFYTGSMIFGSKVSIQVRKYISYILGSSCHIFILAKGKSLDGDRL